MRLRTLLWLPLLLALVAPGFAAAAQKWGIAHEKAVNLRGQVVDLLCELTGDCTPDCGAGRRQLGLLTSEGTLYPAVKSNVFFAGATLDLLPYCGREVTVDGLLIENPAMTLLFVQNLRGSGREEWKPARAFIEDWERRNGPAREWWREDPKVKAVIARDGVFGIPGLEPAE